MSLIAQEEQPSQQAVSFPEFFEDEYPRLVRALMPTTQDLGAAEDAAQEAMARLFERWDRVSSFESPVGYAYTVAVNVHRRRFRRRWAPLTPSLPDSRADPSREVASRDELMAALGTLSSGERDALLLVSYLGLDAAEAGRVLKIEPSSVRSRLHRARTSLRAFIEETSDEHR